MKKFLNLSVAVFALIFLFACNKKTPEYTFHSELQEQYLKDNYLSYTKYCRGAEELSLPVPIVLNLGSNGSHEVKLSLNEELTNAKVYNVTSSKLELYNLYASKTYYYSIDNKKVESFSTCSGPRNVYVDGVTNIRDIGAYKDEKGTLLNQGYIYRSSKFTEDESQEAIISTQGITTLQGFGIKTELDLRKTSDNENGGLTASILGSDVNYVSVPMKSGGNIMSLNRDVIKDVFEVFGDVENYPIVFHCSIGVDRAGYIAFLLEALCGVNEEWLYRDYLFSNFGYTHNMRTYTTIETYLRAIEKEEGDNLSAKTYNYLLSIGVDDEDISTAISVLKPLESPCVGG